MNFWQDSVDWAKEFLDRFSYQYILPEEWTREGYDGHLVAVTDPDCYIAEQYKALCSKLLSTERDEPIKTILVTSAQPGEGKTTTICNLAATLSETFQKRVLLLDTDLRRPATHSYFGISKEPGLFELIHGVVDLGYFTQRPLFPNLTIVPSGKSGVSPSGILNSNRVKVLLETVKDHFDYVLLDAPPVLKAADAQALGPLCDFVLFVVEAGATPRHMISEAFSMMEDTGSMPDACILNSAERLPDYYSFCTNPRYRNYYLNKYSYYGED